MKSLKVLFVLTIILFSAKGFSELNRSYSYHWSIDLEYTEPNENGLIKSVVVLRKNKEKLKYIPNKLPWGVVSSKRFRLDGKYYFATVWPNAGARIVEHKVFAPDQHNDKNQLQVVCSVKTASEEPELKLDKGDLMIKAVTIDETGHDASEKWQLCKKLSSSD